MFLRIMIIGLFFSLSLNVSAAVTKEIIDSSGDGSNGLSAASVHADSNGNIYIGGTNSDNLFRITASTSCSVANGDCNIVEILDANGDGVIAHDRSSGIATDIAGNVYIVGQFSDNVWRINNPINCSTSTPACDIKEIIGPTGDGTNTIDNPVAITVDTSGNVYVAGASTHNVFRIAASTTCSTSGTACSITEIIDSTADGTNTISQPVGLAVDSMGSVFVTTQNSDNVFKIATPGNCNTISSPCTITEIIDDSTTTTQSFGRGIIVDGDDNVYVTSLGFFVDASIYKINTPGTCSTSGTACDITKIYNAPTPQQAGNMAVDNLGNVYFVGGNGDNAFKIDKPVNCSTTGTPCTITEIIDSTGDGLSILDGPGSIAIANSADVYIAGGSSSNAFRVHIPEELVFSDGFE